MPDRNGGFPRLSDGPMLVHGAHGFRCSTSPRHALLAENLGKPSLGVIIKDLWYEAAAKAPGVRAPGPSPLTSTPDKIVSPGRVYPRNGRSLGPVVQLVRTRRS